MATTIGKVEFLVGADGSILERELRAIGQRAGTTAGNAFDKSFFARIKDSFNNFFRTWSERIRNGFRSMFNRSFGRLGGFFRNLFGRSGKESADSFSNALAQNLTNVTKTFKLTFDEVGKDIARFSKDVVRVGKDLDFGRWSDDIGNLRRVVPEIENNFRGLREITSGVGNAMTLVWHESDKVASSVDRTSESVSRHEKVVRKLRNAWKGINFGRIRGFFKGLPGSIDKASGSLDKHQSLWHRLSANTRQWTLIVAAVIASMSELAGLASAAGSGLFTLLAAGSAGIVGLGSLIAGFVVLNRDLKDVPKAIQPAAKAFDGLKDSLKGLQNSIAVSSFRGTEGAFKSLSKTVNGLKPAFDVVGKAINGIIKDLAKNIRPGTKNFQNLSGFVEKSAGIFDRLVRMVGRFGGALLSAFNKPALQQSIEGLLGWLDLLVDRFSKFVESKGFDEWLRHGRDVFGAFGKLLDTTGRVLNDLVTDDTIKKLVDFIGNIERFLQGGGAGLLQFAEKFDLFGLLAQALADIGDALKPLDGPMQAFADALNDVLSTTIDTLAPIIEDIAKALAPFVQGLADFMKQNPQAIANGIIAIATAFAIFKGAKGIAGLAGKMKGLPALFSGLSGAIVKLGGAVAVFSMSDDFKALFGTESNVGSNATAGALAGSTFGWIGALIGGLGGVIVSAVQDLAGTLNDINFGAIVLSALTGGTGNLVPPLANLIPDDWRGSDNPILVMLAMLKDAFFNTGTFFGTVIPAIFSNGWAAILAAFQNGWKQITTFFTVAVPNFFAGLGPAFINGWNQITNWFQTNVLAKFQNGWKQITAFFTTAIPAFGTAVFGAIVKAVTSWANAFNTGFQAVWRTVTGWFDKIASKISSLLGLQAKVGAGTGGGTPARRAASGTVLTRPTRLLAGEDGPEAIVPLRRNLNRVDPSVRWLSAIAQGKTPAMASGGLVGGKQISFAPGSIVVQGSLNPARTALDVADRIAEVVAG